MDRLFDRALPREDRDLTALAEVELRLEWHRRLRRVMVAAAAMAGLLCWAHARLTIDALVYAPPLFAFFALSAASLCFWERRLGAQRRRLLARLPALTRLRLGDLGDRL